MGNAPTRPNGGDAAAPSPSPYLFLPQVEIGNANGKEDDAVSGFVASVRPNEDTSGYSRRLSPRSPSPCLFAVEIGNDGKEDPSVKERAKNSSLPGPSPSPNFFPRQEKRAKEAEFHTNVHNLRKMAQELLEKGYNDKGFYLSTMVKCLEKNSKDPEDIPYSKWLVGMDSMVSNVGSSYCYWDMSTRIDYRRSPLSKEVFGLDIYLDNKRKVFGDIIVSFADYAKLTSGFGWPWPGVLASKIELLFFGEHKALKLSASGFGRVPFLAKQFESYLPERVNIAGAIYESWMKLVVEASYDMKTLSLMSCCIGGAIETNDFLASVMYWRDSLIGSCVKKFSRQLEMGIEVSKPISSKQHCTMTFGVCKGGEGEPGQLFKMKINNLGVLNGSIERTLWPKAVVSVSSQVNLKNVLNRPRFGLKVLFNPPAVTRTYDIGTESWE